MPPTASPSGAPNTPQELVRWVPAGFDLPLISEVDVLAFSGGAWGNVRVSRKVTRGRFAMPRGHVASDLVAIVLAAPEREEGRFGADRVTDRGRPGTINVLPAGMPYTYGCEGTREVLHLSVSGAGDEDDPPPPAARLRPAFAEADPLLFQLGVALLADAAGGAADPLYGETLGSAVGAHLARRYGEGARREDGEPARLPPRQIRRVLDFIEAHLADPLGLATLARVAGMSRTRFIAAFARTVGRPPHRYLVERRVERAKALLADPDAALADVAAAAGYADQTTFARAFRRVARVTPGAYRRLLGGRGPGRSW